MAAPLRPATPKPSPAPPSSPPAAQFDLWATARNTSIPTESEEPGRTRPGKPSNASPGRAPPHRYPAVPCRTLSVTQLNHELAAHPPASSYAPYFLTVNSIVQLGPPPASILCQGRGSAANSTVCWVLAITSIDPTEAGLLFERFVSAERPRTPRYRRGLRARAARTASSNGSTTITAAHRAALCATVIRYRAPAAPCARSARSSASPRTSPAPSASQVWGWSEDGVERGARRSPQPQPRGPPPPHGARPRAPAHRLPPPPRHSTPAASSSRSDPLSDLVPIEPASMQSTARSSNGTRTTSTPCAS